MRGHDTRSSSGRGGPLRGGRRDIRVGRDSGELPSAEDKTDRDPGSTQRRNLIKLNIEITLIYIFYVGNLL